MGTSTRIALDDGFAKAANTRQGHIIQNRVITGHAIRDLQYVTGLSKGQATAMLDPKRGSRSFGL